MRIHEPRHFLNLIFTSFPRYLAGVSGKAKRTETKKINQKGIYYSKSAHPRVENSEEKCSLQPPEPAARPSRGGSIWQMRHYSPSE